MIFIQQQQFDSLTVNNILELVSFDGFVNIVRIEFSIRHVWNSRVRAFLPRSGKPKNVAAGSPTAINGVLEGAKYYEGSRTAK